ncbi:hypothetical protein GCM10010317_006120 [Streptomyces mirabilis]|nr:hypothetical protein GCM10010317_006120 [Streptomyces mirabilis]
MREQRHIRDDALRARFLDPPEFPGGLRGGGDHCPRRVTGIPAWIKKGTRTEKPHGWRCAPISLTFALNPDGRPILPPSGIRTPTGNRQERGTHRYHACSGLRNG